MQNRAFIEKKIESAINYNNLHNFGCSLTFSASRPCSLKMKSLEIVIVIRVTRHIKAKTAHTNYSAFLNH